MRKWLLLCGLVLAISCGRDDTLLRGERTMADIRDGVLTTDNGLTYHIAEDETSTEWKSWNRTFITCDILRQRSEKAFDIRLTEAHSVLRKEVVAEGAIPDETLGDDPIQITSGWVSGGYINLLLRVVFRPEDEPHLINLVRLPDASGTTVRFRLRHNSHGDYYGAPGVEPPLSFGIAYVSFPVPSDLPEADGADGTQVEIRYRWHLTDESGNLLPETEEKSLTGRIPR